MPIQCIKASTRRLQRLIFDTSTTMISLKALLTRRSGRSKADCGHEGAASVVWRTKFLKSRGKGSCTFSLFALSFCALTVCSLHGRRHLLSLSLFWRWQCSSFVRKAQSLLLPLPQTTCPSLPHPTLRPPLLRNQLCVERRIQRYIATSMHALKSDFEYLR